MRIRVLPAAMVVALSLLTGCSSGDASQEEESPKAGAVDTAAEEKPATAETRALAKDVRTYIGAYFGNDASTSLGMMSQRCQDVLAHEAEHADKRGEEAYAAAVADIAEKHGPREATDVTVDEVSGDQARVSYRVKGLPEFDQKGQPWLREKGAWKYDAC
ncbi:hypothetical protein [Streptomyces sp. NPDC002644]